MESLQAVIACMINSPAPVVAGGDSKTPRKPAAPTHVRRSSNAGASPLGMAGLNLDSMDGSPSPPSSVVSDESHAEVSRSLQCAGQVTSKLRLVQITVVSLSIAALPSGAVRMLALQDLETIFAGLDSRKPADPSCRAAYIALTTIGHAVWTAFVATPLAACLTC